MMEGQDEISRSTPCCTKEEEDKNDKKTPPDDPGDGGEVEVSDSGGGTRRGGVELRRTVWRSLRRVNYRLYATLCLRLLFPTLYATFRVYILGSMPDASSLSIASQMAWVNVLLEVVEEGLLLPLYHCLGDSLADRRQTRNKVKTGFAVSAAVYAAFSGATAALAWPLVRLMAQSEDLQEETVDYIRLELVAMVAASLAKLLQLVMVLHQWNAMLFLSLFVQMTASVTLDYLLASEKVANLGVNGVAFSSIGTSVLVLVTNFAIVWVKLRFRRGDLTCGGESGDPWDFGWFRRWTRVGAYSALDSFIRNAVYVVFVIRSMNLLEEQDSYWVCNTFIWSWLLLPALPLADLLKQDISDGRRGRRPHWEKTSGYVALSGAVFALWAASYPLWAPFVEAVLQPRDADVVLDLAALLVPCYVFFVLGNLMRSVFYAQGRTDLIALASAVGNVLLVALYLLFLAGTIPNTVMAIAGIFGAGLVAGFFITGILYIKQIKNCNFQL